MVIYDEAAFKKAQIKAGIVQPLVKPLKHGEEFAFEVVGRGDTYTVRFKIVEAPAPMQAQETEGNGELALLYSCTCPAFIGSKEPTTDPNYQPKPCYHAAAALARLDAQLEKALMLAKGYHQCGKPGCRALVPPTDLLCPDCNSDVDFDQAVVAGPQTEGYAALEIEDF